METVGDLLSSPLCVIDATFAHCKNEFGMHQADALTTSKIQQRFNSFAAENKNYRSIPALDRNALVANSVTTNKTVRYRGLVQDVFEIEYFVGISNHHSDINSAYLKYRDTSGGSDGQYGEDGAVMERLPLFCVPLPGESQWSIDLVSTTRGVQSDRKRPLDTDPSTQFHLESEHAFETPHKSHRVAESEYRETTSMPPPPDVAPLPADKFDTNMQYRASDIDCLVKLYDFRQTGCQGDEDDHSPTVRLNDMIEVIGVFSAYADVSVDAERNFSDPNAMTMALLSGDPFFGFESSANIPRKLVNVPTVHCIIYRKLCSAYPLYYSPVDGSANAKKYLSGHGNVFARLEDSDEYSLAHGECFNSLVSRLSSALGGDDLSAAYVALSVISSVSGRAPGDLVLGALSVNLHGFLPADNRIGMLINVLTEIAPRVVSVRLDRDSLGNPNGDRLFAEKSTITECIERSCLQLGAGTLLLVDETRMTEGPISSCGVRSMKALESVVKSQMLPVDFQYCPGIKIPTDVCVLILSNSPSIIGDSVIKSFSPSSLFKAMDRVGSLDSRYRNMDGMAEAEFLTKSFDVSAVRHWWGLCRLSNASLDECMIPYVEEDFVNARQGRQPAIIASSPPYPVEATDFHNWLTLARLLAIADGSTKITASQWNRMRQLEADRYHNKSRYEAQISAVIQ